MGLFSFLFRKGDNSKLIEALKSGAMLVDVRSPGEYFSGSIPGAINVPMETVRQHTAKFKGDKPVVVFCRSGLRSAAVKRILAQQGITEVVDGGSLVNVQDVLDKMKG